MGRTRIVSHFVAQIGVRVRFLRLERGLSMRALVALSGCSLHGLKEIELGRSAMTVPTIHKLALGLDVQPFDILNHDTDADDLGWLVEAMRHDPKLVRRMRAMFKPARRTRAARAARDA